MKKRFSLFLALSLLLVISSVIVQAQDKITVTWFVGLGGGTELQQIDAQNQVVADFNASQDAIELVITIAPSYETGRDVMSTLIAAGTPPDIVGPVGVGGSNAYIDQWADLTSLVDASGFDLSVFDPALVDLYRDGDALVGIPFAVFPSVMYYNRSLFDEAGLEYPPSEFGEPYVLDGEEVEWNYETVAEIAKILTVDADGNDATMDGFDPNNVIQFGLNFQWALQRLIWSDMQPEDIYDPAANSLVIPESWRTATEWLQDGIWNSSFIPNTTYSNSELFGSDNVFQSGNLAMAITPLWYTCCLGDSVGNFEWDFAVVPRSFDGEYHVSTDADTFRLTKGSANPEAAFTVLSYLLTDAASTLAPTYGAFPAHPDYQQPFLDSKAEQYPFVENWDIVAASLAYNNPGNMHHEAWFPNWQKGTDRIAAFNTLLFGETGADIDIQAELDALEADLNSIANE